MYLVSFFHKLFSKGTAQIKRSGTLIAQRLYLLIRKTSLCTKMLTVFLGEREHGKQSREGIVYNQGFSKRRFFCRLQILCIGLSTRITGKANAVLYRVADFPIGFGIADMLQSCIKCQHPAAFITVIAAPSVVLTVDVHFPALIIAERAVYIHAFCTRPPYTQMKQFDHIHDTKRKIMRLAHNQAPFLYKMPARLSLPSALLHHQWQTA